mgnify:CR=1 FL=1
MKIRFYILDDLVKEAKERGIEEIRIEGLRKYREAGITWITHFVKVTACDGKDLLTFEKTVGNSPYFDENRTKEISSKIEKAMEGLKKLLEKDGFTVKPGVIEEC